MDTFNLKKYISEKRIYKNEAKKSIKVKIEESFTKEDWDVKWKMPKDNLFNATKTIDAVNNRYKALQNLLKDKPRELKAFDAVDDHPAYDMSYDELMSWLESLKTDF